MVKSHGRLVFNFRDNATSYFHIYFHIATQRDFLLIVSASLRCCENICFLKFPAQISKINYIDTMRAQSLQFRSVTIILQNYQH